MTLAGLLAAPLIFVGLGSVPFDDPGEGMHAEIARELLQSREPLPLRLNGVRYLDKPPLLYWGMAVAFWTLGAGETTARLVPALAGLLAVAATAWLGTILLGPRSGTAAGLALITCLWFFVYTRYVRPETLFVAALSWGFALTLVGITGERRGCLIAGFVAFGVAGIAKDFLGALAPLLVIATAMLVAGGLTPIWRWLQGVGLPAAGVLAFGWYVIAEAAAPGFVWYTMVDNHLLNVLGARHFPDEDVSLGAGEFLAVAVLGAAPWIVAAGAAMADLMRRRAWQRQDETAWVVLSLWVLAVFGGTLLSGFRLAHYGVPAYPAVALLAVRGWQRGNGKALMWVHAGAFGLAALACGTAVLGDGGPSVNWALSVADANTYKNGGAPRAGSLPTWEGLAPLVTVTGIVSALAAVGLSVAAARQRRGLGLALTIGSMAVIMAVAAVGSGLVASHRGVRELGVELRRLVGPEDRLLHEGPIENSGALEFYSGVRPIIVNGRRSVLGFGATFPDAAELFWNEARLQREWAADGRLYLVSPRPPAQSLVNGLPADRVRLVAVSGGRRLYANAP